MDAVRSLAILVVDDHALVREGLSLIINRQTDMRVVAAASNGQQAVDLFRQHRPDVVLMDLQMPGMDGIEATRLICDEFPTAVILIVTVFAMADEIMAARRAGAKDCLFKEVSKEVLLAAVRDVARVIE
jgi:DNA-binding NarL/FixJ family response regulator